MTKLAGPNGVEENCGNDDTPDDGSRTEKRQNCEECDSQNASDEVKLVSLKIFEFLKSDGNAITDTGENCSNGQKDNW